MRRMLLATGAAWVLLGPATALADDLGVTLTTPLEGSVVTGVVALAAETVGPALTVTFDVSADDLTWTAIATDATPADGWTADWDTVAWEGPVTIRATASDGAAATASASVRVSVDNVPPGVTVRLTNAAFSPNEDGRVDRTGIELVLSEPADLTLWIEAPEGTVRLLRDTESTPAGPSKVRWRGQADSGRTAPDGRYVVYAEVVDAVGNAATARTSVRVDTRAPTLAWRAIAPEPYVGVGEVRLAYRVQDRAPDLLVRARVTDAAGRPIATLAAVRVAAGEHRLSWDGTARDGRPVEPGLRYVEATVRDDAGNVATVPPEPFRDHRPVTAEVVRRVEGATGLVALTFDDCFQASSWARILDVLHGRHAGASFFCLGPYVRAYPELARRTVAEGHTVGGHGWDHADVRRLDEDQILARLRREADAWWDVARVTPVPYFRPPYGGLDADAARAIGQGGFATIVLWDVDPQDWTLPGSGAIAERVLAHVRSGSIVVLHARDQTARMLPGLIDRLRARGLEPVTLAELLES